MRGVALGICVAGLALGMLTGMAQAAPKHQDLDRLAGDAETWLQREATTRHPGSTALARVRAPDPRLRLQPCSQVEFFLPPGGEPWGTGSVGARCPGERAWSLYMGYDISLRGPALVATRALRNGQPLAPTDGRMALIDYRSSPTGYLQDSALLGHSSLTMPLQAGQPFRLEQLRRRALVKAGQRVRVVLDGGAFQVSQEAIAQQQGSLGDVIRLKTPSGRIIHATVESEGRARIRP